MRVVIAPDSFKGSVTAVAAAESLATGWLGVRPGDDVTTLPMADGGEGTLDAIEACSPGARRLTVRVDGPAGPTDAPWLLMPDGTAVVELAAACGLTLWPRPEPVDAHTGALGQVLSAAVLHPEVKRLVLAVGGSASTDGGTGALAALGAGFALGDGRPMPLGAGSLPDLAAVDLTHLLPPPAGGVEILADVTAPLLGPDGAAAQFGPQKGASPAQVADLERGLVRLSDVLGGDPGAEGAGAAGGTAYGLAAVWGARLVSGSARVADLVGLDAALGTADLVISGEGRLDGQSFNGKVIGEVARRAGERGVNLALCVGSADRAIPDVVTVELATLAGSAQEAMTGAEQWLVVAGRVLARNLP